ncbi:MAG: hypothetical protein KF876_16250 [Nitrospira sp.]|nr:hypothetical protein [Nitrospira sp.]MDR4463134.1 hypothetical protein [Nitrospira sp.]
MGRRNIFWTFLVVGMCGTGGHVSAYEGTGAIDPTSALCRNVQFTEFTPQQYSQEANNTEVSPESEFSFLASKETFPKSIAVTIKDEAVPITVTPHYAGYHVTGNLPSQEKGTFVRINIAAKGPHGCERGDGWLLKVAEADVNKGLKAD